MPAKLFDPVLATLAAQVDDLETLRIANAHRYRLLTTEEVGEDGVQRGLNLPESHPDVVRLKATLDGLKAVEDGAIKHVQSHMRKSVWGPWLKQATGVGEKQLARLLGSIGDPYWNTLHDRPRTVSELWAYCGLHVLRSGDQSGVDTHIAHAAGVAPRRQKGQKANWSEDARKRAWLIATSCVKTKGAYRAVYDATRAKYDGTVHKVDCIRCGPAGKPAKAGSELSAGHQHARALRAVAKEVLKDLWIEARRQYELMGAAEAA
jgi:hypothetical protein